MEPASDEWEPWGVETSSPVPPKLDFCESSGANRDPPNGKLTPVAGAGPLKLDFRASSGANNGAVEEKGDEALLGRRTADLIRAFGAAASAALVEEKGDEAVEPLLGRRTAELIRPFGAAAPAENETALRDAGKLLLENDQSGVFVLSS